MQPCWRTWRTWQERFGHGRLPPGAVVGMDGHYNAQTLSLLLALMQHRAIIVPLSREAQSHHEEFCDMAQVEYHIRITGAASTIEPTGRRAQHPLYDITPSARDPGAGAVFIRLDREEQGGRARSPSVAEEVSATAAPMAYVAFSRTRSYRWHQYALLYLIQRRSWQSCQRTAVRAGSARRSSSTVWNCCRRHPPS